MRIEKNVDGNYILTCCPEQLRHIRKALRVVAVFSSPEMDRVSKIADYIQTEIGRLLPKYGDFEHEEKCVGCPALFDVGQPRCMGNHE